ncbi:MAG: 4'-phosphopantetheinyl transferase superfamily protein [bacterium]|nr:4'-phosphopantetheinyl transferase superfamily protein [bacterium]
MPSSTPDLATVFETQIQSIFPREVAVAVARATEWDARLLPQEEETVAGAVAKRRREFGAGRASARRALASLGVDADEVPLPMAADRCPVWPPGFTGSITHCEGFCGAAVARASDVAAVGFDAEPSRPVEQDLIPLVLTDRERTENRVAVGDGPNWSKLVFSAKESFYKCYYPVTLTALDFHDVEIALKSDGKSFEAEIVSCAAPPLLGRRNLVGRYIACGGFIFTAVSLQQAAVEGC